MKEGYIPTIGLEIHAELKTRTKMFCNSKNDPDETKPNVNVCPVCLAHPGTLPVINREAVHHVLRVGTALKGKLADYTEFDRKNYFYPDLPKGYQLSQYEYPLVSGGELEGVSITRVHLEEDTASSAHDEETGVTTIDYNRAGVPLMELVTEPVIESAEHAGRFARELQLLLKYLGASDANMEKGEMRVEANVSVRKEGTTELGTKVEIKNLNSFRAMERAVAYEIKRQSEMLEKGENVMQETRGWDEGKQKTFSQRTKEGSADYRYFPDPDLPSLLLSEISEFQSAALKAGMPELPQERRARYLAQGLQKEDADLFVSSPGLGGYFEAVIEAYKEGDVGVRLAANYIANDLVKIIRDTDNRESEINPEIVISALKIRKILDMQISGKISSRTAKDLLIASVNDKDSDPEKIANEKGLLLVTDLNRIKTTITTVLDRNQSVVSDYVGGKEAALEYLVGQVMKELRGAADAAEVRAGIKSSLGKER
ncbi:Asp-tRNA(Asn)/Glu-tRNA(Gln) amidotransferase subunit GatB [Candidatus Parcubacteria bacterium]|nr:MAG: Asp-tRNA(Asn)/Glu-tRNA(Gln) amidotransferase subunit GatB [Candidatus Parcubacteria bacterium]